jgi:hypothetical protein
MPTQTAGLDWEELLQQLELRNGLIELSLINPGAVEPQKATVRAVDAGAFEATRAPVWRVRTLKLEEGAIVIEKPWSLQQATSIPIGEPLEGLIIEGCNRWSFRTRVTEQMLFHLNESKRIPALRLTWPTDVRSAQRRNFFRVDTGAADVPRILVHELLDVESSVSMQQRNRTAHKGLPLPTNPGTEPALGRSFEATMLDVSGGGLRVAAPLSAQPIFEAWSMLWLKLTLPGVPLPVFTVAKIAHWRVDPPQRILVGLTFSFDHEPNHGRFIADLVCHFAANMQRMQLQRKK